MDGLRYTNVAIQKTMGVVLEKSNKEITSKNSVQKKVNCIVYGSIKPAVCGINECKNTKLVKSAIQLLSKKHKKFNLGVRKCPVCGTVYIDYATYRLYANQMQCLNMDHLAGIRCEVDRQKKEKQQEARRIQSEKDKARNAEVKREREEQKRVSIENRAAKQRANAELIKRMKRDAPEFLKQEREKREKAERQEREYQQKAEELERKWKASVGSNNLDESSPVKHDDNIRVKDFVVRRNIFRCRHQEHILKNIDAKIEIVDKNGEIFSRTVAAGYCATCNTFFIMESTYQYLRRYGTPICRLSDEKAYLKGVTFKNGMELAQQSILMQYGYSVSQEEDLSTLQRRKILSLLVDNHILTRSEIISYLDFFINTKSSQEKFAKAVEKWEDDRDYIAQYNTGFYTKYGVGGIKRLSR